MVLASLKLLALEPNCVRQNREVKKEIADTEGSFTQVLKSADFWSLVGQRVEVASPGAPF